MGQEPSSDGLQRLRRSLTRGRLERLGRLLRERGHVSREAWEELSRSCAPTSLGERLGINAEEWAGLLRELEGDTPCTAGLRRYVLGEKLGEGAGSTVYRATDSQLGRPVAVKLLKDAFSSDPTVRERFLREAQALARLDHPNVIRVYDSGEDDGRMFMVMELGGGQPLNRVLSDGRLSLPERLALIEKAARGVHHAHERGIIHRDLKPMNLLVTEEGEPKVVDFGLVHLLDSTPSLTRSGAILGTPLYMSPEQAAGSGQPVTARTDVYALGAILYEMLTGRPPHTGASLQEVCAKIVREEMVPPRALKPDVPREVELIVLKALEKSPADRYPSAEAFAEDLRRCRRGERVDARPVSALRRWGRKVRRHPAVALISVVLLTAALGGAWTVRSSARQARGLNLLEAALPSLQRGYKASDPREALEKARGLVEEAVELAPALPLAHYRLGEVNELDGDLERAQACWERAAELDPGFGPAHFRLGRVLLWRAYLVSISLWPDHEEPKRAEAEGLIRAGIRAIEAAGAAGSGFDNELRRDVATAMLAQLRGDAAAVRRLCREAIGRYRDAEGVEEFHWLLGLAEESYGAQVAAHGEALRLRPRFPLALYARADAESLRGNPDGAIRDYDEAIRQNPRLREARLKRADVLFTKGDVRAAEADYTRLIEAELLLEAAFTGRGRSRQKRGDLEGALADLDQAVRLKPKVNILAYMARGEVRLARGDVQGAITDCDEALTVAPWGDILFTRGQALFAKGDLGASIADFERVLRSGVAPAIAKEAEAWLAKARQGR
jgi:tetratricopeptide (TPR) repeat protein/tRNA A-37 threonylcarbamoyl transferase component Bud32